MENGQARLAVLLMVDESLLGLAVETLLGGEKGLDVVTCSSTAKALEQMRSHPPQVLVVDLEACPGEAVLEWLRMVRSRPDSRLVALSRQDSTVCVYHGSQRALREARDLVAVIEHPDGQCRQP